MLLAKFNFSLLHNGDPDMCDGRHIGSTMRTHGVDEGLGLWRAKVVRGRL